MVLAYHPHASTIISSMVLAYHYSPIITIAYHWLLLEDSMQVLSQIMVLVYHYSTIITIAHHWLLLEDDVMQVLTQLLSITTSFQASL